MNLANSQSTRTTRALASLDATAVLIKESFIGWWKRSTHFREGHAEAVALDGQRYFERTSSINGVRNTFMPDLQC
jgi:predicted phosphohydrolase